MRIGFIGLGKMGASMVERLIKGGHNIVAFDLNEQARKLVKEKGAEIAESLEDLVNKLFTPRAVWVMVPSGKPTEDTISTLAHFLSKGDIVIDGGNSMYKDSMRRAEALRKKGLFFLDAGTSGGIWGLKIGYCLMVGGEENIFKKIEPVFRTLAPKDGYAHVGSNGAGHFVKMVHNGIEYALLQAYAEGFEIMEAKKEFNLKLEEIAHLWNHGSVIRSWLLQLAEDAFKKDKHLSSVQGFVADSGEGRWTVAEAIDEDVPAPIITLSLLERFRSRQKESFSAKVIAALRNEFGGHGVKRTE
jgi:6-phosphogluconate dehydrogenase